VPGDGRAVASRPGPVSTPRTGGGGRRAGGGGWRVGLGGVGSGWGDGPDWGGGRDSRGAGVDAESVNLPLLPPHWAHTAPQPLAPSPCSPPSSSPAASLALPPPPAGGPPVTRAGSRLVMRRVPGALTHVRPPSLVLPQA
jgi:hypothetical protein